MSQKSKSSDNRQNRRTVFVNSNSSGHIFNHDDDEGSQRKIQPILKTGTKSTNYMFSDVANNKANPMDPFDFNVNNNGTVSLSNNDTFMLQSLKVICHQCGVVFQRSKFKKHTCVNTNNSS